ncbi:MAG: T9SS type A sorting domain-containing protein [Bacteroidota bacterium]
MRIFLLLLFTTGLLSAQSDILVYESFDYADYNPMFCLGDTVNGWRGPWRREIGDDGIIRKGDLVPSNTLPVSGRAVLEFVRAGIRYNRAIVPVEDDGQVLWMAYDVDFKPGSTANNVGNVTFTKGGNQVFTVGRKFGNRKIGLVWPGVGNYNTNVDAEGLHRLVIKIQFSGNVGEEQAWLWVDPDTFSGEGEPTIATADLRVPSGGLPGLRLNQGFDGVQLKVEGTPPLKVDFDNLILGKTYAAIDPAFIVSTSGPQIQTFPLRVSPNPGIGLLMVEWEMPRPGPMKLAVMDLRGSVLHQQPARNYSAGLHTMDLDLRQYGLPTGSYLLRLSSPGYQTSTKIILSKD